MKILWSASGGRCAFPDCWERLYCQETGEDAPYTLGEMAHICGDRPGANRHDSRQTDAERNDYQNLILLCPTHHRLIDRKEMEGIYTVAAVHKMKVEHEKKILERLDQHPLATKTQIARSILPLLEENRQSWEQFGPASELARSQPYNEAAHKAWVFERLSVIVPNNRIIAEKLRTHQALFNGNDLPAVLAFLTHARSYEQWVNDTIPYAAVRRFPQEFDELVRGLSDGSA